jgi:D-alanyl-D-alanine carboxypeptidase
MRVFLPILLISISTCSFSTPLATPGKQQKGLLKAFAQSTLKATFQNEKAVSAISLVSQCKSFNPVIYYAGTYKIHGGKRINKDSLFETGSITKSFVSVVILQLASEYHLNLDSKNVIAKYFPEYPRWGNITLRQLMNMTSGIPGNGNKRDDDIYRHFSGYEYKHYISPNRILNLTYQYPLHFKPGTEYEYSNTNYVLLGQLIQRITGHSGVSEIKTRVFDKLHLKHTYFPTDKLTDIPGVDLAEIVHGYAFYSNDSDPYPFIKFGEDTSGFSYSEDSYAGAIVSTPSDINVYVHALYKPSALLTKAQLTEFTSLVSVLNGQPFSPVSIPNQIGYGLGIFGFYSTNEKGMIYFYQGQTDGFQFFYLYNPKTQQYLTFTINTSAPIITKESVMRLFDKFNKICK